MARIQVQSERKVAPRALPTVYDSNRAVDAGPMLERGLHGIGQEVAAGMKMQGAKIEQDTRRAQAAKARADMTALEREGNDAFYGTQTPTPAQAADAAFESRDVSRGYLSQRGLEAIDSGPAVFERLQKRREELAESYSDPVGRELFMQQSEGLLSQYYARIVQHSAHERERHESDVLKAAVEEAKRSAALNPADDNSAMHSIGRIVAAQDHFVTSPQDAFNKAEAARAEVTAARLEALLAQPGGFTDAERVFEKNKASLGTAADEYRKRIDAAKLGGRAAVEANRIVDKVRPKGRADWLFSMPSEATVEAELAKIAAKDPRLFEKVAPIARAQLAMQKSDIAERKEAFVNQAISIYNKNHATFFASDIAERLNQVDSKTYKALWNETYHRARAAGDDSAAARRQQEDLDRGAYFDYLSSGDPAHRAKLNIDTFLAGRGVSENGVHGKKAITALQQKDRESLTKGISALQKSFETDLRGELQKFAPDPGRTPREKLAERLWWKERTAAAINAFTAWMDAHEGKRPSPEDLRKLKAQVIAGVPPRADRPESIEAAAEALQNLTTTNRPTKRDRALQLKNEGMSNADIAEQLTAEGY
jgi:hypothetical protein